MAQEPKNGRWEAGMNLLFGLVGILLGLLGLSDAPAYEKYRLMWPWLVVLFGVAVLVTGLLEQKKGSELHFECARLSRFGSSRAGDWLVRI